MVSKLSFKGEKKSKKKKRSDDANAGLTLSTRKRHKPEASSSNAQVMLIEEDDDDDSNLITVNNKLIRIEDLSKTQLQEGWTTSISPRDLSGPILITCLRGKNIGCLSCFNNENFVISPKDSLLLVDSKNILNFNLNEKQFDLNDELIWAEPSTTSQVFTPINIDHLISSNDKAKLLTLNKNKEKLVRQLALKTSEGWYLSYDRDANNLTTTQALTDDAIFNFKMSTVEPYKFNISVGKDSDSSYKLIVTDDFRVKVIEDEDNLLDDLNLFTVKVQTRNSSIAKRLLFKLEEKDRNEGLVYHDSKTNSKLNEAVKELMKLGIGVTNKLLDQLKKAVDQGKLNEFMVELKEKKLTDRRA